MRQAVLSILVALGLALGGVVPALADGTDILKVALTDGVCCDARANTAAAYQINITDTSYFQNTNNYGLGGMDITSTVSPYPFFTWGRLASGNGSGVVSSTWYFFTNSTTGTGCWYGAPSFYTGGTPYGCEGASGQFETDDGAMSTLGFILNTVGGYWYMTVTSGTAWHQSLGYVNWTASGDITSPQVRTSEVWVGSSDPYEWLSMVMANPRWYKHVSSGWVNFLDGTASSGSFCSTPYEFNQLMENENDNVWAAGVVNDMGNGVCSSSDFFNDFWTP